MKKAGIIVIGLIMTVFVMSHFFIFKISQNSHQDHFRSCMLQNLEHAVKISIAPSELYSSSKNIKWTDDNKEVIINGELYDVIGFKNSGTTVSLFLITDTKEKELIDNYESLANSLNNTSAPGSKLIKDFLSLKYLQDAFIEFSPSSTDLNFEFPQYVAELSSVFISLGNPPPIH